MSRPVCKTVHRRCTGDGILIDQGAVVEVGLNDERIVQVAKDNAEPVRDAEWCERSQTLYLRRFIEGDAETRASCEGCEQVEQWRWNLLRRSPLGA